MTEKEEIKKRGGDEDWICAYLVSNVPHFLIGPFRSPRNNTTLVCINGQTYIGKRKGSIHSLPLTHSIVRMVPLLMARPKN